MRLSEAEYDALVRSRQPAEAEQPKPRRKRQRSAGEVELETQLRAWKIGGWVTEYRFDAGQRGGNRGWRLDFCWPEHRIAVEVDGGVHRIAGQFSSDIDKQNALNLADWCLLRFDPERIKSGQAVSTIRAALAARQAVKAAEEEMR